MIIEKFDFKDFFDPKYSSFRFGKEFGIGAISIITPEQAITKWNNYKKDSNGISRLGGDTHYYKCLEMVSKILNRQVDRIILPTVTNSKLDTIDNTFLKYVVYIKYVNSIKGKNIFLFVPQKISSQQFFSLKFLFLEIRKAAKKNNIGLKIYISGIDDELNFLDDKDYATIHNFLVDRISDNINFPFYEHFIIPNENIWYDDRDYYNYIRSK